MVIAPEPARAAETLAWAFLAGSLLAVWRPMLRRPLTPLGLPALAYVTAAIASWLTLTFRESTSFDQVFTLLSIGRSIALDHLLFSAPEPETWTVLLTLAGVGMFLAAATLTTQNPNLAARVAMAIVSWIAV